MLAGIAQRLPSAPLTRAQVAQPYDATVVEACARILGNAGRFDDALQVIGMYEARELHGDVEAQTGAVALPGTVIFGAEKLVENFFLVLLADADAGVEHAENYALRRRIGLDGNAAFYVPGARWQAALAHLEKLGIENGDRGAAKERTGEQGGTYMDDPAGYVIQFITDGME